MVKVENIVSINGVKVQVSESRLTKYNNNIENLERRIYWLSNCRGGRSCDDIKSLLADHRKSDDVEGVLWRYIGFMEFCCFANEFGVAWIEQIYLPNLQKLGICIDGISQEMSEGLRLDCEVQVKKLEETFADIEMNLFWDVTSYFACCERERVHERTVRRELLELGYNCFAVKPGLAWLKQIYIPRMKESCKRSTSKQ